MSFPELTWSGHGNVGDFDNLCTVTVLAINTAEVVRKKDLKQPKCKYFEWSSYGGYMASI